MQEPQKTKTSTTARKKPPTQMNSLKLFKSHLSRGQVSLVGTPARMNLSPTARKKPPTQMNSLKLFKSHLS
jgi:hypothetical protein